MPELLAVRDGNEANASDWVVRVIPNKRPVLAIEGAPDRRGVGLYDRMRGIGAHEIVVESRQHGLSPGRIPLLELTAAFVAARERMADLERDTRFKYLQLYRSYGSAAGASIHHPHQQIVATPITPLLIATQLQSAKQHYQLKERCLFCDVIAQEIDAGHRLVVLDDDFITFAPYASRFPYELHLYPRKHSADFARTDSDLLERLAAHILEVLQRLDRVLGDPPLNWMLVTSPNVNAGKRRSGYWTTIDEDFHWHIEILPRLAPVSGFDWGTGFHINPSAPEDAAALLRDAKDTSEPG